jgi:hypothetical protein
MRSRTLPQLFALPLIAILNSPAPATDEPRVWPVVDDAFVDGWTFTPTFEPSGDAAWFHHWADPLNVGAPQQVYRIERRDGVWQQPVAADIAPGQLVDFPLVTPDGKRLIVSVAERLGAREFDFDLYAVDLPVDEPAELQKLNGPDLNRAKTPENARIGVVANELGARMTDAGVLWFWSEREDATGGRDIFRARPTADGFARPEEFALNTPARESHPWISPDGREIIFASNRPGTLGDDDLWYARRTNNGGWHEPCPLPAPINSEHDEELAGRDPITGAMLFTSDRPVDGRRGYRVYEVEWPEAMCAR